MNIELLILKTTIQGEANLILHCLAPDYGRISIMAHGAKKISHKKFPIIGLFRICNAVLNPPTKGTDLYTLKDISLKQENDRLAQTPSLIEFSAAFSRFALNGNFEKLPCPIFYEALIDALQKIEKTPLPLNAWISRLLIVYLMEQGLFPEMTLTPHQKSLLEVILDSNSHALENLKLSENQWLALKNWTLKIIAFASIDLPENPCFLPC